MNEKLSKFTFAGVSPEIDLRLTADRVNRIKQLRVVNSIQVSNVPKFSSQIERPFIQHQQEAIGATTVEFSHPQNT